MTAEILAQDAERTPPEQEQRDEERRRITRRESRAREERARADFANASRAYYLLAHTDHAPERLEAASRLMDEAASVLR